MVFFKNLSSILMELIRNLSWPLSRSRTHAFVGSLFVIALFFYLSAILADNSPAALASTLASRFLSTSNSFSSIANVNTHFVSNSTKNCTDGTTICSVAAAKRTHRNSKKQEADTIRDLSSCDVFNGHWVIDNSDPVYQPGSCPYIDVAFNCFKNGRQDSDYLRLRWQPNGCRIPRFDGKKMLEILRGKRLVFVGDSLNRNMWESLVCALRDSLKNKKSVFEVSGRHEFRTQGFYSFRFKDYNCSIEFLRSPFLVQEWKNSDLNGTRKETLRLDLIQGFTKYQDANILIFNTGHWWTHQKISRGMDYFQEGNHVYGKLDVTKAYTKALHTWAQWIDANIDTNRTRVFFRGYSASHFRGGQWNSGGNCHGETQPITNDTYLAPDPWMANILESVIANMKTPVFYLNITRMTDYRKDGHPSIFREPETQRKPGMFQDCSHWCLPGVPDAWNEILYATLLISNHDFLSKHHRF